MENITILKNIISDFEWTAEAFENAQDLYDYSLTCEEIKEVTFEECELAFK